LEEVIEADLILHVRDVSHADSEAQASDVEKVLRDLDIDPNDKHRLIEVWNKIDLLGGEARQRIANVAARREGEGRPILASALTGEGLDELAAVIEARLTQDRITLDLVLDPADGAGLSWLYRNGDVVNRALREDGRLAVTVRAEPAKAAAMRSRFAIAEAPAQPRAAKRAGRP
jgi:GTP-binding protein HflX